MSKPWGRIGAWAAEAEREEEEERAAAEAAVPTAESQNFPSLKEAARAKPKNKKMTLSEFNKGTYSSSGGGGLGGARVTEQNRLTHEEMMLLPTRPKERSSEELQYERLGGGFSSYGRSGPGAGRVCVTVKIALDPGAPEGGSTEVLVKNDGVRRLRQSRYGGLGTGGSGGFSKADEVDNWTAGKRSNPTRSSTFGSGFRDSGPEPDRWSRSGVRDPGPEPDRWSRGGSGGGGGIREDRPILVLDPPRGEVNELVVKTNRSNLFGAAKPREEVLAKKGLDWKKLDSEIEAKKETSRPTSAHSSRPSSAQSSRSEGPQQQGFENAIKTRPKVNPFGAAKPREVLLEERGRDWRKIDLDLDRRRIDRPETEEEKILKEEERPGSGAGRTGSFPDRPPSQFGSIDVSRGVEFMDRPRSRGTTDAWTRPGDERRGFKGGFQGNRDVDRPRSRDRCGARILEYWNKELCDNLGTQVKMAFPPFFSPPPSFLGFPVEQGAYIG
ncbi:Sulfur E2 [Hibiscus syriacus]|uniref:Sulfur E2 n=1 Tax=Hibiscus syriacus TaxID=106335 RepID=A0A6A3BRS4_HIBSY|nr:Sulfur E2 [Hibiscus syriacus]